MVVSEDRGIKKGCYNHFMVVATSSSQTSLEYSVFPLWSFRGGWGEFRLQPAADVSVHYWASSLTPLTARRSVRVVCVLVLVCFAARWETRLFVMRGSVFRCVCLPQGHMATPNETTFILSLVTDAYSRWVPSWKKAVVTVISWF